MEETKVAAPLELCRECLGLRGPCFDTFSHCERTQRCACEPKEPLWKAYDYNKAIELCRCCAWETVSSGSRWSPFFCEGCKALVVAHNRAAGGPVVPIGRHSIMNGIFVSSASAGSPVARAALTAATAGLFTRMDRSGKWFRDRVRAVVHRMPGAEPAVPLAAYLEHARARGESRGDLILSLSLAIAAPADDH
jgi:hypothetical protein